MTIIKRIILISVLVALAGLSGCAQEIPRPSEPEQQGTIHNKENDDMERLD